MNPELSIQLRLPGYNALDTVFETAHSTIFRGERLRDNLPVLIKVLKARRPSVREAARLRREFEIASELQGNGIIRYYAAEPYENGLAIIMEDFRATSLAGLLRIEPLRLPRFFELAVQAAAGLSEIHAQEVIHKDIKPDNMVWGTPARNAGEGDSEAPQPALKYIDFGISSKISRETAGAVSPGQLEGTLAYMSPEQTGRMNRAVDYRSDFYSLGVTFFEMLFGRTPFPDADAMELVHSHIARDVAFPETSAAGEAVPPVLLAILRKLLAKTAEERYESAHGLRADLHRCQQELTAAGKIPDFPIGENDISDVFRIPQKLYGREREIERLMGAFEKIENGQTTLMMVAGKSGVGKSALLGEIHKPIARSGGHYIAGKFDQFKRDVPFSALIQALQELVRQLIGESDEVLAKWRERMIGAFGPNGQVIIDVIPEVELITGEQMPLPELPPTESRNRFRLVFQNFIQAFADREHPLAIFLDDLQWADSATLDLLKVLLTDPDAGHLLVVGAYRDNEVSAAHPLLLVLEEIRLAGQGLVEDLSLQALGAGDVAQLTADALHSDVESVNDLAELIFKKTDGNPFHIGELLRDLYTQGLILFDTTKGAWTWDLPAIQSRGLSDDVVSVMTARLKTLPRPTVNLLRIASALGNRFDLRMLSLACGMEPGESAGHLEPALTEGLVLARSDACKYVSAETTLTNAAALQYGFVHDRVQQAAYDLLDTEERARLHRALGRLYLDRLSFEERDEQLLTIVSHLNAGRELLTEAKHIPEKIELAELNLAAGRKSRGSTAYESAVLMYQIALEQLPANPADALAGDEHYQLYMDLNMELGETCYILGDLKRAERYFQIILTRAKTNVEKLRVYEIKIGISTGQSQPEEAVRLGIEALDMLGMRVSTKPSEAVARAELQKVAARLKRMNAKQFLAQKQMKDPLQLATMQILMQLGMPAYVLSSNLFPVLVARMLTISLRYGNCPATAYACAAAGTLVAGVLGETSEGYRLGTIGIDLVEKLSAREVRGRVYYLFAANLHYWQNHVSQRDDYLNEAYRSCLETGDLPYVALCVHTIAAGPLWVGTRSLNSIERSLERYENALFRTGQRNTIQTVGVAWQYIRNLQGAGRNRARLSGEKFSETEVLPLWEKSGNANGLFHAYWAKATLATLSGTYEQAVEFADLAWRHENSAVSSLALPVLRFYHAIARIGLAERVKSASKRRQLMQLVSEDRARLLEYARQNPENFQHMRVLLDAELARVDSDHGRAIDLYDEAIETARAHHFPLHQAFANELAAAYYTALGKLRFATIYLHEARRGYSSVRVLSKTSDMELAEQELMRRADEHLREMAAKHSGESGASTTLNDTGGSTTLAGDSGGNHPGGTLDMSTVLKASQAISGELQLSGLLQTMIRIVMENAGAQRGVLLLEQDGQLRIEADGQINESEVQVLQSIALDESDELPRGVINTVERTRKSLVIYDARSDQQFARDRYVVANQPRSILAKPIVLQGKLIGIIYLEHNGAPGAFTEERVQTLNILGTQIGTSIENARLYSNLEKALEQERVAKQAQIELNEASSLFVPTEFLRLLGQASIVGVGLGDNIQKEMTVLFSDIRSFTTISESLTPAENFAFINGYLAHVGPCVREHGGFIDKYIGDAVMALFPDAASGVAAALAMQVAMERFNAERAERGEAPVEMGIGLNTGQLMLGTIGEANRMEGTVISDAVNLASRIEGLTKMYGARLIVSGQTWALFEEQAPDSAKEHSHRLLDVVRVKGKREPVEVIEILSAESEQRRALKEQQVAAFAEAREHYCAKRFAKAANQFKALSNANPDDMAAKLYRARSIRNHKEGVPEDWQGIEALGKK